VKMVGNSPWGPQKNVGFEKEYRICVFKTLCGE